MEQLDRFLFIYSHFLWWRKLIKLFPGVCRYCSYLHDADYFRGEKCTPFTCKWTLLGAISHDSFICGEADRSGGGKCSCSCCCCCCCWTIFQSPMYSFLGCEMTKTLSQKGWEKANTLSQKGCEKAKTVSKTVYIMVRWFVTNTIFHAADQWKDPFFVCLNFACYHTTTRVGPEIELMAGGKIEPIRTCDSHTQCK